MTRDSGPSGQAHGGGITAELARGGGATKWLNQSRSPPVRKRRDRVRDDNCPAAFVIAGLTPALPPRMSSGSRAPEIRRKNASAGLTLLRAAPIFSMTVFLRMASTSPFGEHLKREREMRGVSLEEVSSATRISTRFLVAIESGQWNQLPGGAFNRGFIRSTSRYLGLDEDGMVAEYSLETTTNGSTHAPPRVWTDRPRDWKRITAGAGLIVLLAGGGWFIASKVVARLHATHATDTSAQGSNAPSAVLPNAALLRLTVHASAPTEVQVVADGKKLCEGKMAANEEEHFGAREGFQISTSDAAAVQLELNGQPLPKIGPARQSGRITLTAKDVKSSAGGVH